jgi:hypothetical protein
VGSAGPAERGCAGQGDRVHAALDPLGHAAGDKRRYAVRARNAAGTSPLSAAVDLPAAVPNPPPPDPKPGTVNYPADLVGKCWYLTVPVKDPVDGWAMEIEQPTLATYDSKYFLLTDDHTGAVFRVWHGGATTSGSKNPRSELREQTPDGKRTLPGPACPGGTGWWSAAG